MKHTQEGRLHTQYTHAHKNTHTCTQIDIFSHVQGCIVMTTRVHV
jgi:hypothetical protein